MGSVKDMADKLYLRGKCKKNTNCTDYYEKYEDL